MAMEFEDGQDYMTTVRTVEALTAALRAMAHHGNSREEMDAVGVLLVSATRASAEAYRDIERERARQHAEERAAEERAKERAEQRAKFLAEHDARKAKRAEQKAD